MADAHQLSERVIDMARRFEDVVDAAEGKGNRGSSGIGTKWLLLPAAGAGLYALVTSNSVGRHAKGVLGQAKNRGSRAAGRPDESRPTDLADTEHAAATAVQTVEASSARRSNSTRKTSSARKSTAVPLTRSRHSALGPGRLAGQGPSPADRAHKALGEVGQAVRRVDAGPSTQRGADGETGLLARLGGPMGLLGYFNGFGGRDMAVDLGTANTLVYVRGRGIVLSEPSVVAIDQRTGEVHAVGVEAKRMLGRTPGTISAIRPLKDGVIADFDVTEQMLRHFIQKVHQHRFAHPRVVVCVPSGVTGVEKRAVEEATLSAGARQAYLIEEPMAAAIGAGLPVAEPTGNMIVDIGGGTTEVAVISLGGIVVSQSLRVGGDEMDEAIISHIKTRVQAARSASRPPRRSSSRSARPSTCARRCRPRCAAATCSPACRRRSSSRAEEVRRALDEPVGQIIDAIKSTLDKTPPELAADIMDRGIVLAGGGALLNGLDERLRHETQMPVHLAESPLTCVAVGSGRSLEEFEAIHRSQAQRRAQQPPPARQTRGPPPLSPTLGRSRAAQEPQRTDCGPGLLRSALQAHRLVLPQLPPPSSGASWRECSCCSRSS